MKFFLKFDKPCRYTNKVLPFYKKWGDKLYGKTKYYLIEDKAPCHTAKIVREAREKLKLQPFLSPSSDKFSINLWPASSPDLNVIENAWSVLKDRVQKEVLIKNVMSRPMLVSIMNREWNKIRKENLHKKLTDSFRKRLQKVIELDGAMTGY